MINIDCRFLADVDENELWLLCHIVKRFNESLVCWPTNKTLCNDTGWSLKKVQTVKTKLIERGLLVARPRFTADSQSSNEYMIDTELMGVYVPAKRMRVGLEDAPTPKSKLPTPPESKGGGPPESKRGNEVLTIEVLENSFSTKVENQKPELADSGESEQLKVEGNHAGAQHTDGATAGKRGPKRIDQAKARKREDVPPEFHYFIEVWHKHYPGILQMPKDGAKVKSLIKQVQSQLRARNVVPTPQNTVEFWRIFVENLQQKAKFYHGKTLSVIDSHFPSIVFQIEHGEKKGGWNSQNSAERMFGNYGHL